MRIAVDASRTTLAQLTGTERYALELIRALIALDSPHTFNLYFRDPPSLNLLPASGRVAQRVLRQPRLWTHTAFASALWRDRPDVTFVPAHSLPLVAPGRMAVTVHDLGFRYFPQAHPWWPRLYLHLSTAFSVRRAHVILADSRATAADLTRLYGMPSGKIRVVYPGVDPLPIADMKAVRQKYGLPQRYFLFIGTLQPRKNIARLVQAYARWRLASGQDDVALVLAGGKGWLYDESWTSGVDGVLLTGYVDEADKGALYAGALALVFPSLYEGFGFPILEAMRCGTPVICSNTSSLPELAGDAALLVDPLDIDAIADAMSRVADDADLRHHLILQGRTRAAEFTWERAARETLAALESV